MQAALAIPEIRLLICTLCVTKSSLARLAQANKTWLDPALDILYRELILQDIPKCLPGNFLHLDSQQLITPIQWNRFSFYGNRVRKLSSSIFLYFRLSPAQRVALATAHLPIFPRLLVLDLSGISESGEISIQTLRFFLSPTLVSLTLNPAAPLDASIASALPRWCPNLREFHIVEANRLAMSWEHGYAKAILAMLCQWEGMRSLILSAIDPTLLDYIGSSYNMSLTQLRVHILASALYAFRPNTFSSLVRLSINHHTPTNSPDSTSTPPIVANFSLPRLRTFRFHGEPFWCATFLRCTEESPLESVNLGWSGNACISTFQTIATALSNRKQPHLLQNIVIDDNISEEGDRGSLLDHIGPLLSLKALRSFELNSTRTFHVSDQEIKNISIAWKNIASFVLFVEIAPPPSLESLAYFTHCPNLSYLCLPIRDASDLPDWCNSSDPPDHVYSNSTLKDLCFGPSHIEDPFHVAAYISRIFPSIQGIDAYPGQGGDTDEQFRLWNKCREYMTSLSEIRQQGLWKMPKPDQN
ncbi:hypothetical protein DL96DRAFT_1820074 [Flagelloscypha sp. PMI_526]|nr:hypothetical protein DL96DRAFT_1820074 [Flagelloscypha sp. PMI_526]